jgi:tyrosine-protein kinase Etk/Wzc
MPISTPSENSEFLAGAPQYLSSKAAVAPQGIALLDALLIITKSKGKLALITIGTTLLGAIVAFAMKPVFTSTALIMPPQAPQSSLSSLMGSLGSLSALSGGGASSFLKNPSDLYVGILQSETIANRAIATFNLQNRWHTKSLYETRKRLEDHVNFEASKNGLIQISAKEKDPQQASALANFFVDALYQINSTLAISEASQRRLFFEQQLDKEKEALASAEEDLKKTQQKTGIITVSGQAEMAIRSIAEHQAEISQNEIKLQATRLYATEENPEVIRLKEEISTQQQQLATLEDNQQRMAPGDTRVATNQFTEGSLDYVRKLREVKYHDALLAVLSRQYEAARVDEAKSAPLIQVVDRATPPDHRSGPPRMLIIIGFAVLGFLVALGWIFLASNIAQARQTSAVSSRLDRLRTQLAWR